MSNVLKFWKDSIIISFTNMHEILIGCLVLPYCRLSSYREERVFSWTTLLENSTRSQTICVLYFSLSRGLFGLCVSHPYFVYFSMDNQIHASAGKPSLWLLVSSRQFQTTTTTNMMHCWTTHYGLFHR